MTSPARSSRKSARLENQSKTPPSARRKSERSINTPARPPPASPDTPVVEVRKSDRLGTPTSVRKSKRLLGSDTSSPLGNTGKSKDPSSSAVGLGEGVSTKKKKRAKKEKTIEMLQTETSEIPASEYEQHYMPLKRTLDARAYKAQFKAQKKKTRTEELRRSDTKNDDDRINNADNGATSSHFLGDKKGPGKIKSADNGAATCSPILGDKKDLREIESVDNGTTNSPVVGYKKDLCEIETVTCSPSSGDKKDLDEEDCCRVVEDLSNDLPEGVCEGAVPESHSGLNELNALPITNSVESITSLDPVNGLAPNGSNEGNKKGLNLGASESVTPSSSSHNPDFVANCFLCSKKRRLVFDSPEEICSCTETPKGNLSDMSCQKSSNGAFAKLQTLPGGISNTTCDSLLSNVNRLRDFRLKNQNAVVVDETERMVNMIVFIFSLSDVHKPFLVTGTSDALVKWEAEFIRLKPSVNVVVYQAAWGARNCIKSIEFHREGGGKLIQVLLCSIHVISENSQILQHLKCELLVVDECQFSMNFDLLKMLDADMKILLFSGSKVDCGSLKDKEDEFLSVLSFLDPSGEDKEDEETDSLLKLVERFSSFIAYDSTKFVEYWVPVPLSNLQLEQYCHTLHSGTSALTSYMKTDVVGDKVYDVLMTAKKCCDHPYVVDGKLVDNRVQHYSSSENVDYGIKASGKLHLLSKLLSKIKSLKLRALVLYQLFDGSRESIGDMLEDLLRARFGPDQYERIEYNQTKKQAAVNRFNKEDSTQFVFLLENRACHPSIKLSADVVVIFSSDWSPACDIRTLERLTFNSRRGKVPIFRLYCSCTVEEKVLILGKQLTGLNARSGNMGSTILMWGASSLFSRLEDYHAGSSKASDVDVSSEHALLDNVAKDLMDILSDTAISDSQNISIISFLRGSSIISKAFMCSSEIGIIYHTNPPLLGERKYQPTVEEPLVIFWKKLLEGRTPQWKFSHEPASRNRKRGLYSNESTRNSEIPHDEAGKKRKKMNGTAVIANKPIELDDAKEKETAGSEKDALNSSAHRKSFSRQSSVLQPDNRSLSEEQQSLHDFLKADIAKLWKALKLSEDVQRLVCRILEHVIDNHKVSKDDPNALQALKMSLCWIAADMLGQKIDRKSSLVEARKILNFECPEDLANNVYTKLLKLKNTFPQPPGKPNDSVPLKNVASPSGDNTLRLSSTEGPQVKVEDIPYLYPSLEQNQEPNNGIAVDKKHKKLRKLKKKIEKQKLKLLQDQEEEIHKFNETWNSKRDALEKEHQVELTVLSLIHSQSAMKMDKLKAADNKFDNAMKDLESTKETELKELENKHAAKVEEENRNCENWLADFEKKYGGGQSPTINDVVTHGFKTSNDRQLSPTGGTTTRVLGRSPPITSDHVASDVSANGETELMTMQGGVPGSAEQFEAAKSSSQNPKDVSAAEATSNGHILDEIQSTNRGTGGTGADSGLLENHGGPLPQDRLLIGEMDLTDVPIMLLNNNGDTEVQPDLCQNPVSSSHECDDPVVSVDNPGLEAASLSDCQGDREQTDLHANIMDSADGGNHFESHASEGPGNMPHEQLGLGNAGDVTNTAGSHNHTLSEVAGNAAEFQSRDVLPVVQPNGAASQNPPSISRVPTIAVEAQHQHVLHPGPSYVELPNVQAALNQRLRMLADPLQGEIDKMWKDREQMIKMHEDAKLHLRAECEKEITEVTTQIRKKYAEKVQDAESSYIAKRTEIEANQSKVFMNKLLAEAFRSKCLDFRPSGAPVAYPGMPSVSLQQHTQLVPSSSSLRNSPVNQPASTHHQTVNPAHCFPGVGSSSSSSSLSTSQTGIVQQQTLYPPSAQSTHRPTNLSGITSRPPPLQVGSHTPNIVSSRVGGSTDIRAPAPHLQPFRPSTSVSSPSTYPLLPPQQPVTSQVPRRTDNPPALQPGPLRINQPASNARVSENEGAHISAVGLSVPVSNKADDVPGSEAVGVTATSSILSGVVCLSDDDN